MKGLYIHQAVSITAQGFWEGFDLPGLKEGLRGFRAFDPDYKTVIPTMSLRRMSKITKMALMCGLTISKNTALEWDGIIVGTGLGNLADTERFLKQVFSSDSGLNSPTAFTQSSHNALSGQLALQLKNHGYNMTHVQRHFSLENALKDASLQIQFGMKNILLGAADEHIAVLDSLAEKSGFTTDAIAKFGEGASFFQLSADGPSEIVVRDLLIKSKAENHTRDIDLFLKENQVDQAGCLLISTADAGLTKGIAQRPVFNLVGNYLTNSGIAMHLGCSYLSKGEYENVLVVNNSGTGLVLTLLGHG